jgi:predicted esterase
VESAVRTLREFFAAQDAGERARLAAEFGQAAPKSWDAVRTLLHTAAPFPPLAPGRHALMTEGDAVVPAVNYCLRVPAGYASDAGRAWPLVIGLHGAGGSGEGFLATLENLLGDDAAKYLLACPDAPEGGVYKVSRVMTEYPLRVLEDVRRRANVDSDRVVLLGVSKGGYTVWGTILFSPGEWAGAVPIAAWPLTEAPWASPILYAPNILGLGVQAHWGADDILPGQKQGINTFARQAAAELKRLGATRFEPIEYPGQGHHLHLDAARIRAFLASARRGAFPDQFQFYFHRLWQGRAYFVRATGAAREDFDFKALPRVSIANKADLAQALCRTYQRLSFELRGLRKADENALTVFARNLEEVEIEIGAEQMDFSRPITVLANGRPVLSGPQAVDWTELLETARQTYDFERLVARRLRCKVEVKQ